MTTLNKEEKELIPDDEKNLTNLFEIFDIQSRQNNRYLIVGPSGSGKTHLQFQLMFFELPKYKRHIYVYGGLDKLKQTLIPYFKSNNIEVFELCINTGNELNKINFDALGKNDLVVIDDLSHVLSSRDNDLIKFLNKAYTCSRQRGFDIITILHKLKLNNKMLRDNATKIIITGLNKEIEDEFKEHIVNKNTLPIIIDICDGMKQKRIDFSSLEYLSQPSKIIQRIAIQSSNGYPSFVRRHKKPIFVDIKDKDESFQYKVPNGYFKVIDSLSDNFKKGFIINKKSPFVEDGEIQKEIETEIKDIAKEQRKEVNTGQKQAGNDNINKPTKRLTFHKKRRK